MGEGMSHSQFLFSATRELLRSAGGWLLEVSTGETQDLCECLASRLLNTEAITALGLDPKAVHESVVARLAALMYHFDARESLGWSSALQARIRGRSGAFATAI